MTETMWAARLVNPGQPLEVSRVPVPRPGPGELLLKLEVSGICHTDLHVAEGKAFPSGAPEPLTLGHEGIGQVVEAGPGTRTPLGMRLGAPWLHDICGRCRSCLTGSESFCPDQRAHGFNVNGSFAEYVIVQERLAAVVPAAIESPAAAPLMCAGVTAYGGVLKADLAPGKLAVIVGCGGLGQYGIQIARLTGATVVAVDTSAAKLREAEALGADACFIADDATADKVKALGGADAVLNFAPSNRIWPMVTGMVNNLATIVSVAMVAEPVPLVLEWLTYNGVKITGTSVGTRQQMQDFLALSARHGFRIDLEMVALRDINAAMQRLARGGVRGRLVIDFAA
ncbi:alcohol dehydrogenase catalytic domain-containing protein [Aestuariivirga sp.]|jgi:propanol-preferring alcohol dehydrogenase|uniref:alcohol dehydrogenase catalytic domain-containing protein n=1 Tax=Aestuariivirga sp. TaxID=2650926 RepID=UPI0037848CE4